MIVFIWVHEKRNYYISFISLSIQFKSIRFFFLIFFLNSLNRIWYILIVSNISSSYLLFSIAEHGLYYSLYFIINIAIISQSNLF
jgi:hypothetical protein